MEEKVSLFIKLLSYILLLTIFSNCESLSISTPTGHINNFESFQPRDQHWDGLIFTGTFKTK